MDFFDALLNFPELDDVSEFETVLDPSNFPLYEPAEAMADPTLFDVPTQLMMDPTFFEYDSRGVIDVFETEENQAEFQKLYKSYESGDIGYNTYARQISELQQEAGSPVTFMNIGDPSKNLNALAKFLSGAGSAAQAQKMGAFGYDKPGPARGISGVPTAKGQSLANIAMEGIRSTGGDFGVNVKANQVAVRQTVDSPQIASRRGSTKATPGNIGSQVQKRGFDRYIRGLA
tara:strand:+ start:525 stop:1217 length:693 start_codon:yes stop_codon:yes gene_type:complete